MQITLFPSLSRLPPPLLPAILTRTFLFVLHGERQRLYILVQPKGGRPRATVALTVNAALTVLPRVPKTSTFLCFNNFVKINLF